MTVTYLPRSAWGARQSKGPTTLSAGKLKGIAIHWPGMGARKLSSRGEVASALRGWQNYHMDPEPKGRGWSDIAYQIAVDQEGRAWVLRGLTTRSAANGDELVNLQYGAILLVLGTNEVPTLAMVATVRGVISDFRRHYPKATAIVPHSAVRPDPTDCPGDKARRAIASGLFTPLDLPPLPPKETAVTPAQMTHLETYTDGRMKAYARWLWLRQCEAELQLAQARKDSTAVNVWSPLAIQAKKDWDAVQ